MWRRKPTTHGESNYTVKQKAVVARSGKRVADRLLFLLFACVPLCAWGGAEAQGTVHVKKGVPQHYTPPFPAFQTPARRRRR